MDFLALGDRLLLGDKETLALTPNTKVSDVALEIVVDILLSAGANSAFCKAPFCKGGGDADGNDDATSTHACTAFCNASDVAGGATAGCAGGAAAGFAADGFDAAFCKASCSFSTVAAFCQVPAATGGALPADEADEDPGNSGCASAHLPDQPDPDQSEEDQEVWACNFQHVTKILIQEKLQK